MSSSSPSMVIIAVPRMAAGLTGSPRTFHLPRGSRNSWNTMRMVSR